MDSSSEHHSRHHKRRRSRGSSSEIEEEHKRRKKHKKHHHSKKHKHSHERESTEDSRIAEAKAFLKKQGVSTTITEADYFAKNPEFRLWLLERKKIMFEDLSADESRSLFRRFVKKWNSGRLAEKYYKGIEASELLASQKTKHKWVFKQTEQDLQQLEEYKDRIDYDTHKRKWSAAGTTSEIIPTITPPASSSSSATTATPSRPPPIPKPTPADLTGEDMDEEDRRRYNYLMKKKMDKSFEKRREADLEELVPKPTGREAMIEKRKQKGEYAHRDKRADSPEMDDDALFGSDSFQEALRRQRAAEERKHQRFAAKREEIQKKQQQYREKEQATIEHFKALLQARMASSGSGADIGSTSPQ